MSSDPQTKRFVLGESTPVAVGFMVTIIGAFFAAGIIYGQFVELNNTVKDVLKDHETRLRVLERKP